MMKFSIIIPVYNVGELLINCVQSIIRQDFPSSDYEVIIVDDGSKDDTYKIAQNLANANENVFAFTQPNQGQSGARNNALEKARGEYVWFVDGDDYILPNSLNRLYSIVKNNDLDALYFWLQRHYEGKQSPSETFDCVQRTLPTETVLSGIDAVIGGYYPCSSCAAIYRLDTLNRENLRFVPKIFRQDVEFTYRSIPRLERVMFLPEPFYVYYTHEGTVTTSQDRAVVTRKMSGDGYVAATCLKLAGEYKINKELSKTFFFHYQGVMIGAFLTMLSNRKKWKRLGINNDLRTKYRELGVYPIRPPYKNFKFAMLALFFNTFGKLI